MRLCRALLRRQPEISQQFPPVRLADGDASCDEGHGQPERRRHRFAQAEVCPEHRAGRDQVVEKIDLAGFPVLQRVIPEAEGDDAAYGNAVELDEQQAGVPRREPAATDLNQSERQQERPGPEHRVRADLRSGERVAELAALASIDDPQDAATQGEQFAGPCPALGMQGRPKEGYHAEQCQQCSGGALEKFSALLACAALPQECPYWRGTEVECHVRGRCEVQRPVEKSDVDSQAQASLPPELTFEFLRANTLWTEPAGPAEQSQHK